MTASLSLLVPLVAGTVVGIVLGVAAAAIVISHTALKALRAQLAERTRGRDEESERVRALQAQGAEARVGQARAEAERELAAGLRDAAERRERAARTELDNVRQSAIEREREFEARLADAIAARARAEADLENVRTARAEADSRFGELAQKIIADAQAALTQTAATQVKADGDAARAEAQAKLAEITAGLTARLDELGTALGALHTARERDSQDLATHLGALGQRAAALADAIAVAQRATDRVSTLLSTSQARGAWGEFELRRLIEMTGMTEHVSFGVQQTGYGDDLRGRPDVVLFIAGGGTLPIDAKVPFEAYQAAACASDPAEREARLSEAVAALKTHVRVLAQKQYHAAGGCIGWTIMFVPIESMLSTVLGRDPELLHYALENHILIASPLSLLVYLYAFAQGWSYASRQENARHILEHAKTLIARLGTFAAHFMRVGAAIDTMAEAYNSAVGSFERNVGAQARRIYELGGAEELTLLPPRPVELREVDVRRLPAPSSNVIDVGDVA
ncbi:MAG: DNA recombination protein RmuC [Candidatus Eremiobacteraeota bacterium]|nr:DNA recombination protein RmuC [Candidatus Eremiobacteraeota bacterium]